MEEQELRVFIDIVSQYFERQTGRLPEIGSPYLGEANALPIYDFTGVIGISGERQGCVYFTAHRDLLRQLLLHVGEADVSDNNLCDLVGEIAIGAIKFQDLKNTISAGYVFELEDFAKFEGKTGPYIQYAIARINSILRKAKEKGKNGWMFTLSAPSYIPFMRYADNRELRQELYMANMAVGNKGDRKSVV